MNVNACTFCKHGKRKCDKARPSCSNCLRLRKACVYKEDSIHTNFVAEALPTGQLHLELPILPLAGLITDTISRKRLHEYIIDTAMLVLGSGDKIAAIADEFFVGTHQRIPALSKIRFYQNLDAMVAGPPRADFATLCLCISLIQQLPSSAAAVKSPLYIIVKTLINLLEVADDLSLDFAHCRILVTFYEMGHGLHRPAYLSLAACARTARVLGLQRKAWRAVNAESTSDFLVMEEEKRAWWAILIMDRFINLCNGDALFVVDDPERSDPLPIDDLLWSDASAADLHISICHPLTLDTPIDISAGQMARESQVSHLAGRVARHVFMPTVDAEFNAREAAQLERTLKAYLPLLSQEELKIGKYCAAFGICNSALLILYEMMMSRDCDNAAEERQRILDSMEETSKSCLLFGMASYGDVEGNYPPEVFSPYLTYSLCQMAIIQHRLWKNRNNDIHRQNMEMAKMILASFARRWKVAEQYLEILASLDAPLSSVVIPHQGSFISTGKSRS